MTQFYKRKKGLKISVLLVMLLLLLELIAQCGKNWKKVQDILILLHQQFQNNVLIRMITKNTYKSFLLNFETRFEYLYVQERQVMETNS